MRQVLVAFVLAASLLRAALGQSSEALRAAVHAFDEAALRLNDDNARPALVHKWLQPIKLAFSNASTAPGLVGLTRKGIKTITDEAGLRVSDVDGADKTANFVVLFDENGLNGQSGYCFSSRWGNKSGSITKVELRMNPMRIRDIDRCAIHEPMYSIGFTSHPHAADRVLSCTFHATRTLTVLDKNLIHTLDDTRMTPGMKSGPASHLACRILGEHMGSPQSDMDAVRRDRTGPTPST